MSNNNRQLFTGQPLIDYFTSHTSKTPFKDIYIVKKELKVFKKTKETASYYSQDVIVNLRLPKGTLIHADLDAVKYAMNKDDRKMRASQAAVHSMFTQHGTPVKRSRSAYDRDFTYAKNKLIRPKGVFFVNQKVCAPGIHFFLNVQDAIHYDI